MKFLYLGTCVFLIFLSGCESKDQEREELDLIVQLEEQEESAWDKLEEGSIFQEGQEMVLKDTDEASR